MNDSNPLIFINYRSDDEPLAAVLLDVHLSARLGSAAVFLDNRSLRTGRTFDSALLAAVRRCAVLLVVIGGNWLTSADDYGRRRVDSRADWVRREIAEAYKTGTHVVPVLVGDVSPLSPAALPSSIRPLAREQFLRLRHRDSRADLRELTRELSTLDGRLSILARGDTDAA